MGKRFFPIVCGMDLAHAVGVPPAREGGRTRGCGPPTHAIVPVQMLLFSMKSKAAESSCNTRARSGTSLHI